MHHVHKGEPHQMRKTAKEITPDEIGPTDIDSAVIIWRAKRKSLVMYVSCYDSKCCSYVCGLANPPGGSVHVSTFEKAWNWYVGEEDVLPIMDEEDKQKHRKHRSGDGI
jgi:hypothetical protein